jgi:hypothetical protein
VVRKAAAAVAMMAALMVVPGAFASSPPSAPTVRLLGLSAVTPYQAAHFDGVHAASPTAVVTSDESDGTLPSVRIGSGMISPLLPTPNESAGNPGGQCMSATWSKGNSFGGLSDYVISYTTWCSTNGYTISYRRAQGGYSVSGNCGVNNGPTTQLINGGVGNPTWEERTFAQFNCLWGAWYDSYTLNVHNALWGSWTF